MIKTTADAILLMSGIAFVLAISHTKTAGELAICWALALICFTGPIVSIGQEVFGYLLSENRRKTPYRR